MHTFFCRLPEADRETYIRNKLRRRMLETKRAGDTEALRAFADAVQTIATSPPAPALPIVEAPDQPTPSGAQREVIDQRIACALKELESESPLEDGERIEDDFFSYLSSSYAGLPAGTPVLRRRTDRAEIYYTFDHLQIVRTAELVPVPPPAFEPTDVPAPPAIRLRATIDTRDLFKNLATGVASGIGGKIGALIFDAIFPPGVPSYFDQVYAEIRKIIEGELTQNTIDTINGELNGTVRWIRNTYQNLKLADSPPPRAELFAKLEPYVATINTRVLGPLMEKRYEEAGFSAFMVAAPVHLALLQEQALIDPNQADVNKSAYVKATRNYAQIYADHAKRVLGQLVKARRERVKTIYNGEWIVDNSAAGGYSKPGYSWKDTLTGEMGRRHSEYKDDDKNYHDGSEEANRDRDQRRNTVEQTLRRDLGTPTTSIEQWRQLVDRPIPGTR